MGADMKRSVILAVFSSMVFGIFPVVQFLYAQTESESGEQATEVAPCHYALSDDALTCTPTCYNDQNGQYAWFRILKNASRLKFQGWVESGLYVNSHGIKSAYDTDGLIDNSGNGPMYPQGLRTTNYNMNQLWASLAREIDCKNGLDWGFRTDFVYGMSAGDIQSNGDDSFDSGWGNGDYDFGFFQLYGEVGYKKLSAKYGKFGTPLGWESVPSWDNFFYSHSYCYSIEPTTHTGVLVDYRLTDRLKLVGGWTAGMESGFTNRYNDKAILAGLELRLRQNANIYYYMTQGRMKNGLEPDNTNRFDGGLDTDYFIHSLCFEWNPAEKFTHTLQYNLSNLNEIGGDSASAYGVSNCLLYTFDDRWSVGLRAEWFRDNGVLAYENAANDSINTDILQVTYGLNYNPTDWLRIRPEIRYDRAFKNEIFATGTKKEQITGGFAVLIGF
jgi:Protein of unknown function (DUF1597).